MSLIVIAFLIGILTSIISPIVHPYIGILLFSIIIGVIIRNIIFKVKICYLTKRNSGFFIMYLSGILFTLFISLYFFRNQTYSYLGALLIGLSIGYIAGSIKLFLKAKSFKTLFIASQDYLFISQSYIFTKEAFLHPLNLFLKGRYRYCIKVIESQYPAKSEESNLILSSLNFRCRLFLKDFKKAEIILSDELSRNIDDQTKSYYNYLIHFMKGDDVVVLEKILLDVISRHEINTLPIIRLNLSYLYNKEQEYQKAVDILAPILNEQNLSNIEPNHKIDWIYSLNNYCFCIGKMVLQKNNYFHLLEDNVYDFTKNNHTFQYSSEDFSLLKKATILMSFAYLFNSQLEMSKIWRYTSTHQARFFLLNTTNSIIEFAQGNFLSSINILNSGLERYPKQSYPLKLLTIYNAVAGNGKTARNTYLEYRHLKKKYTEKEMQFDNNVIRPLLALKIKRPIEVIPYSKNPIELLN